MFCHAHPTIAAAARCTGCGVLLCGGCREKRGGRAVCRPCATAPAFQPLDERIRIVPVAPHPVVAMPHVAPVATPICPPPLPPAPPAPPARRSPFLTGILGVVPGLGHLYAGKVLRGLAILGVLAPVGLSALGSGALPGTVYAFLHGLIAFDGYRQARKRNGEWTPEDGREARGVWFATAGSLALVSAAIAAGAPISPILACLAFLIPLGVGIAMGERQNTVDARADAARAAIEKSKAEVEKNETPWGRTIDKRADRAALAAQFS